ncbi:hypothetical protein K7472_21605 [Streptomyces sp. PTM05]|uniref:Uncharacterized protein n=1 Tax=Streptantibioticus parmotrematis TaxID=2873249 RepID=A0ABS7QW17_9ACTN|nr:hypothetical protein [Streptantibioticus parmotrematis]MBY8887413.1 hypothetical protein [Streptantibioticus parmotrematis]
MNATTPRATALRVLGAAALATAALGLAGAGTASATTPEAVTPEAAAQAAATPAAPQALTASQVSAGRAVAGNQATLAVLGKFFAADPDHGSARARAAAGTAAAPRLSGASVTVYTLDPAFVAGTPGAAVAQPSYVATDAVSATGQTASVWTARTAKGWQVVNIASGDDETAYTAKAHGDGTVFREPQINAWYVLRGDRVLPLDTEATAVVGAHGTTVAAYQRHVRTAYGHMLPGSAYDKQGYAGGFGNTAPDAAARAATRSAAGGQAGDQAGHGTASRTAAASAAGHGTAGVGATGTAALAGGGAVLTLAAALGGRALRRRSGRA